MKRILTIITTLLLSSSVIFAQEADMKVGELLNTSDWFELERVYPALAADVQAPMLKQMAEVMLASNFNRPAELREKLQKLIAEHEPLPIPFHSEQRNGCVKQGYNPVLP